MKRLVAIGCLLILTGCGKSYVDARKVTSLPTGISIEEAELAIGKEPDLFRVDDEGCYQQGYIVYSEYHDGLVPYKLLFCPDDKMVRRLSNIELDEEHLQRMIQRERELAEQRRIQREIERARAIQVNNLGNAFLQNYYQQQAIQNQQMNEAHRDGMDALDRLNQQIRHDEMMRELRGINYNMMYR